MQKMSSTERSVRQLRQDLADVLNSASVREQTTYVTSRGRRVAAVVPVPIAEAAERDNQASRDADTALMYAMNVVIREDDYGAPSAGEIRDDYAAYMVEHDGGGRDRWYAAARAACIDAASEVAWPGRYRPAICAVDLCQRAARISDAAEAAVR